MGIVDARQASSATYELPTWFLSSPTVGAGALGQDGRRWWGDHGDKQRATNVIRTTSRGMSVAAVVIGGARPVPVCETDLTFGRRRSFG